MKQFLIFIGICIFSVGSAWAQQNCTDTSCLPAKVQEDCTIKESNGCIDWTNGVVYATGMGVPNPDFKTPAQKRYSAYQAAKIVAQRNLLQMVEGINITSTQTVKAGMLEDDTIQTEISGRIKHVQEVGKAKTMNDGSIWVTMKMYLRDIISIMVDNQQFELGNAASMPATSTITPESQSESKPDDSLTYGGSPDVIYSGLIIDASGSGLTPAMAPKVYDPEGKEVYGSAAVERDFVLQHGIVGYAKDIEKAKNNDRIKGNPLLIKATLSPGKTSDVIISKEDAKLLNQLESNQTFLREARVMIVI